MASGGDLVVRHVGRLVTNDAGRGSLLGIIDDAAVVIRGGRISWVGEDGDLPAGPDADELFAHGAAVIPGFVDAHTHVVFGGDRADEFGQRLRGDSYESIMERGGGIRSTVSATRAASSDQLFADSAARVRHMINNGTTTLEAKSGYGLDVASEVKLLEVIKRLGEELPVDVLATFLGAHVVPPEYAADREAYITLVVDEMLPRCAPMASFIDVFCDSAVFTPQEARRILAAGAQLGLVPRLHAEQLAASGGARIAAEFAAASADHLDHVTPAGIDALAAAGTSAVLLPGVSLSMRIPYPDPQPFLARGVTLALATDANPGTSYILTMPFVVALACLEMGLSPEQAVWSATRGGALSLRMNDRGWIGTGAAGDLVLLDAESHVHLAYRPDSDLVASVVKDGSVVNSRP